MLIYFGVFEINQKMFILRLFYKSSFKVFFIISQYQRESSLSKYKNVMRKAKLRRIVLKTVLRGQRTVCLALT